MDNEFIDTEAAALPPETPSKTELFKSVCARLGLMMIVVFVSRGVCTIIMSLLYEQLETLGVTTSYIIQTLFSFVFLYIIPMAFALFILKEPSRETRRRIYSKPLYFGSAMGMFPAFYGISILTNILTMLVGQLFTDPDLNRSFNTVNELAPANTTCAVVLFVQLAIIAPLFEEFWFRGIVMESLRPYGNGFAIFVSAILFGLTHSNFQQFFYATALGICLGYIAISTKSIVTTTIMHAMFNSVSGILLLFMSDKSVGDYILATGEGEKGVMTPSVTAYLVFLFAIMLLMAVGVIMFFFKLRKIKRYKVPKVWAEMSAGKRWGIFFSRAAVIIMLVLAADTFTFRFITKGIVRLISLLSFGQPPYFLYFDF